jgi:hypothetical protein
MEQKQLKETRLIQALRYKTNGDASCEIGEVFAFGVESREETTKNLFLDQIKQSVCFAYMESSEYHSGVVPKALLSIQENYPDYAIWNHPLITQENYVIGRKTLQGQINDRILEVIEQPARKSDPSKDIAGYMELDNEFLLIFDKSMTHKLDSIFSGIFANPEITFQN